MKIGEPIAGYQRKNRSRYTELHVAIEKAAAAGLMLPIECDDMPEAMRIYNALRQNGRFVIRRGGLTLFATLKKL